METKNDLLTEKIIGGAIEVHRELGPGLLESAYEECLCYELSAAGIPFERQLSLPVKYKTIRLSCGYTMDLLIDKKVVVELKTVKAFERVHFVQLMTYLRLSKVSRGLLINFHVPVLKDGLKRMVNNYK